jgi:hypothetical protein
MPDGSVRDFTHKDTNPKDAIGVKKVPLSVVPMPVVMEAGLGMMEGGLKYGRHNYRVSGIRASVYFDATMRHMTDWWEGEDIDPASRLSHVTKAISSLFVLRDAMMNEMWVDDRPPRSKPGWMETMNRHAGELIDMFPEPAAAYTQMGEEDAALDDPVGWNPHPLAGDPIEMQTFGPLPRKVEVSTPNDMVCRSILVNDEFQGNWWLEEYGWKFYSPSRRDLTGKIWTHEDRLPDDVPS